MSSLELLLRGVSAGAMMATAVGLLRGHGPGSTRYAGALFCAAAAAFSVHSGGPDTQALGILGPLVWLLSAGGVGWFWLFAMVLFQDRKVSIRLLAAPAVMIVIPAVAMVLDPPRADGVWVVHNLLELILLIHVLGVVWRSWGGDLVEARRSLRGPFLALVACFAALLSGVEMAETLGVQLAWASLAQAAGLAAISFLGAAVFLNPHPALFERPAKGPADVDAKDRAALGRLQGLMDAGEVWRREGLTIGQLADEVGVPEHRLRRLINDGLGCRNFAEFLNARRIEAAKAVFADPMRAETPISSVAFDLGYASLGPFNRAFKDATGLTPSAWRTQALAASSIP